MGIKVKIAHGENVISLMRRFKRLCERENIVKDYKKHSEYEKPSDKNRRARNRRMKNIQRYEEERMNPVSRTMEEETTH